MTELRFYRTLTDQIREAAGIPSPDYAFSYVSGDQQQKELTYTPGSRGSEISGDPLWELCQDGIRFEIGVRIENCASLYGKDGICPQNGRLGICLLWKIGPLSLAGTCAPNCTEIVPQEGSRDYCFAHSFLPGQISGTLSLEIVLYLKSSAHELLEGEGVLNNTPGVTLGSLVKPIEVKFENSYVGFPVEEVNEPGEPLWWLDLYEWGDPREDDFSDEHLSLKLNKAAKGCPAINKAGKIVNANMLTEIVSSAYFLLFQKLLSEDDQEQIRDTKNGENLEPRSISDILYQFSRMDPDHAFVWSSPEKMLLCIKRNVTARFSGGADDERL